MSWKKNVFSNFMWNAYVLIAVAALAVVSRAAVRSFGGSGWLVPAVGALLLAMAVLCALLLHRLPLGKRRAGQGGVSFSLLCEAVFMAAFLASGFFLRAGLIAGVSDGGPYYGAALVAEGNIIRFMGNGAEYVYLKFLHGLFMILGNKLAVGIWAQALLQMAAVLLLYFGVRKLAGAAPALVMLGFFMFARPVVRGALALSPEPLFLLLFACGFGMLAAGRESGSIGVFLTAGLWAGLTGYVDVTAFLLAPVGMAAALEDRQGRSSARARAARAAVFLAGIALGFVLGVWGGSYFLHKPFLAAVRVWGGVYAPGKYADLTDVLENGLAWQGPLAILLCFGVAGYWYHREREFMSGWVLAFCLAAAVQYAGIPTAQVPFFVYLFFLLTVLAGIGVGACLNVREVPEGPGLSAAEASPKAGEAGPEQARQRPERPEAQVQDSQVQDGAPEKPGFLENPLPLPKPHRKKVLDYAMEAKGEDDDYDYPVDENDDFDIK